MAPGAWADRPGSEPETGPLGHENVSRAACREWERSGHARFSAQQPSPAGAEVDGSHVDRNGCRGRSPSAVSLRTERCRRARGAHWRPSWDPPRPYGSEGRGSGCCPVGSSPWNVAGLSGRRWAPADRSQRRARPVQSTMTWVGLDVHARSVHAAAIDAETGELRRARLGGGSDEVVRFLAVATRAGAGGLRGRPDGLRAGPRRGRGGGRDGWWWRRARRRVGRPIG